MTGKEIKELREKLGMKQDDLAKALGISFSTVSRWETEIGNSKPNDVQEQQLEALKALSDKTGDYDQMRKILNVVGVAGIVTVAVAMGVSLPGALAGSIGGIGVIESIKKLFKGATAVALGSDPSNSGSAVSSTLSGAALTNASLAALGGGAAAAGGTGMTGGTVLVTGVGAAVGESATTAGAALTEKTLED